MKPDDRRLLSSVVMVAGAAEAEAGPNSPASP
jgi:hypothetical protein